MKSKKKAKIEYGTVDFPEGGFEPQNVSGRITMWIKMDVLDEARKRASEKGLPYQTYLNQIIRAHLFGDEEEERIRKIVREEIARKTS